MRFEDEAIIIEKDPNDLDELVLDVTSVLDDLEIEYAVVSGYFAVLLGRSRATEDIDVIVDSFSQETAEELATCLREAGYWGSAMPLDSLYQMLSEGSVVRVAEDGHRVPNVELKFPSDEYDRASLENTISVRLNDRELQAGELELQIAYKLYLGSEKDLEDALYVYKLTEQTINTQKLEEYARRLDVETEYERLTRS